MSIPKHKNPSRWADRQEALAPYNFVPLPEQIITVSIDDLPDQNEYHPRTFSGYLDNTLTVSSPLFTRSSKDTPDFFSVTPEGIPVIPGSGLRGLFRTLVEVVGFGKLQDVSANRLVYRSIGDTTSHGAAYRERFINESEDHYAVPRMRAGYMVKMDRAGLDWAIRPAKEIGGTTFALVKTRDLQRLLPSLPQLKLQHGDSEIQCANAYSVYFANGNYDFQPVRGGFLNIEQAFVTRLDSQLGPGLRPGTLTRSGRMFTKRHETIVFEPDLSKDLLELTDDQVQAYRDQLSPEQKNLLRWQWIKSRDENPKPPLSDGVLIDGYPVFYLLAEDGSIDFFGHCRLFRLPYPKSPADFVPEKLRQESDIDLAEAIFGYTKSEKMPQGKARMYAGRVFFSDARLLSPAEDIWLDKKPTRLKILSGPKPTTFQHYLVQTNPDYYQSGRTKDGKPKYDVDLKDYAADQTETVVRGHKFYWHKGQIDARDIGDPESDEERWKRDAEGKEDTQHTSARPVKAGTQFHFRISFENLTKVELGVLLWILELAADENYRLKLGMGKPLGMGAIRIESNLQLINRRERYSFLLSNNYWQEGIETPPDFEKNAIEAFEIFAQERLAIGMPFKEIDRIRMLLAMHQWPGPDRQLTRYMEIERPDRTAKRGKRNEYRGRPVLPDPLHATQPAPEVRPDSRRLPSEPRTQPQKTVGRPVKQEATPKITLSDQDVGETVALWEQFQQGKAEKDKKDTADFLEVGDRVRGIVTDIKSDGTVFFAIQNIPDYRAVGRVLPENLAGKQYRMDNQISVEVIAIDTKGDKIIIDCKAKARK